MTRKVWFVGAGPGDPELITVKARDLIAKADAILYAGSLVPLALTKWCKDACTLQDSKGMALEEITAWLIQHAQPDKIVIRLQTGDPSLYGALIEMIQPLDKEGIESEVIPGISSAMASAAASVESLTLPEVTQTVILTRVEGRTPMPEGESLKELASHHATLCLFLSITLLHKVTADLIETGWAEDAPVVVVQKASWGDEEKIVRGTLSTIKKLCQAEKIASQAMIIVSPTLGARHWDTLKKSKLYDQEFTHRFRKGIKTSNEDNKQ
jgi:precorrin-4/cobalt-precorrin-4 C11-methyltransferase